MIPDLPAIAILSSRHESQLSAIRQQRDELESRSLTLCSRLSLKPRSISLSVAVLPVPAAPRTLMARSVEPGTISTARLCPSRRWGAGSSACRCRVAHIDPARVDDAPVHVAFAEENSRALRSHHRRQLDFHPCVLEKGRPGEPKIHPPTTMSECLSQDFVLFGY